MRYVRALKWSAYAALLGLILVVTADDSRGQGRGRGPGGGGGGGGQDFGGARIQLAIPGGAPGGAQVMQFQGDPQQIRAQYQQIQAQQAAMGVQGFGGQGGGGGRGRGRGGDGGGGGRGQGAF